MSSRFFWVVFSSPIVVSICIYGVSSPLPPLSPLRPPNQPGHAQRCNTHAYHGDHPLSETGYIRGGVENKRPEGIQDIVPHTERITWWIGSVSWGILNSLHWCQNNSALLIVVRTNLISPPTGGYEYMFTETHTSVETHANVVAWPAKMLLPDLRQWLVKFDNCLFSSCRETYNIQRTLTR